MFTVRPGGMLIPTGNVNVERRRTARPDVAVRGVREAGWGHPLRSMNGECSPSSPLFRPQSRSQPGSPVPYEESSRPSRLRLRTRSSFEEAAQAL